MIVFINYYFVIYLLRFYQLLALYIFFLITLSVAVLLRPLGVSSNQFVTLPFLTLQLMFHFKFLFQTTDRNYTL